MIRKPMMFLVTAIALCYCVLSFYQTGAAQSGAPRPNLADPAEQQQAIISNLEQIKTLLKEQNSLLRSGQVKVIVTELPKN